MSENERSPARSLYENTERPARVVKVVCQMIIGIGIAVALIAKIYMLVLTDHQCVADVTTLGNKLRCNPALEIAAYGLALSTAFELAFLMFKSGTGGAIKPLIFGITSAFLLIVSDLSLESANWQVALVIFVLSLSIGGLFYFKERFVLNGPGSGGAIRRDSQTTGESGQSWRP